MLSIALPLSHTRIPSGSVCVVIKILASLAATRSAEECFAGSKKLAGLPAESAGVPLSVARAAAMAWVCARRRCGMGV